MFGHESPLASRGGPVSAKDARRAGPQGPVLSGPAAASHARGPLSASGTTLRTHVAPSSLVRCVRVRLDGRRGAWGRHRLELGRPGPTPGAATSCVRHAQVTVVRRCLPSGSLSPRPRAGAVGTTGAGHGADSPPGHGPGGPLPSSPHPCFTWGALASEAGGRAAMAECRSWS